MMFTLPLRLLVEVTFHYEISRLKFLFQSIRGLFGLPVESMDVMVSTNIDDTMALDRIRSLCSPLLDTSSWYGADSRRLSIESHPHLDDPWHLPWCHKRLITDQFLAEGSNFTHFAHIEDDLLLSLDNLLYFVRYAEALRPHRLIPAFLRVEYNHAQNELRLVDQPRAADFGARTKILINDLAFVNLDYSHQAMYILDRPLALEYVRSRSFDRTRSVEVRADWGLCERASMGLCFESPPQGFWSRHVVPVYDGSLHSPSWTWIYHLPNNYSENPRTPFGKARPDQLFSADRDAVGWSPPNRFDDLVWRIRCLPTRILRGKRNTGHNLVPPDLCAMCGQRPSASSPCTRSRCPAIERV